MAIRVKGQENVVVIRDSSGTVSIDDITSIDIQFDRDTLSEGYIGQTTEQKDDIFKGVSGKIEFHFQSADWLDFVNRVNLVSRRRLPGEGFQIISTITFPNGDVRRIVVPSVRWGAIPISNSSRDDYITVTLDFMADDARILAA